MGLAVLPARLKEELELLEEYILEGKDISSNEKIEKHASWVQQFLPKYKDLNRDNIHEILQKEVGNVFVHVLEDAGVINAQRKQIRLYAFCRKTLIFSEAGVPFPGTGRISVKLLHLHLAGTQ